MELSGAGCVSVSEAEGIRTKVSTTVGLGAGAEVSTTVGVGVGSAVSEGLALGVGVESSHAEEVKTLSSRVTEPLRASARPSTVAPVIRLMDVRARIVPTKSVPTPKVAELPTWKKTLQGWAPLIRLVRLLVAVVSVEPIWKMKTELGSSWPSSVRVPVSCADEAEV